jgi:hypothetical protein
MFCGLRGVGLARLAIPRVVASASKMWFSSGVGARASLQKFSICTSFSMEAPMKRLVPAAFVTVIFAGYVLWPVVHAAEAAPTAYQGEVWTWDEPTSTVTLRSDGGQTFRVKVPPERLRTLRLHEYTTVRGELQPPAEIERIVSQAQPMRPVPRGPADQSDVTGTVAAVDASGLVSVDTPRGRATVWAAPGAESRFKPGEPVRLRTSVQAVDMVPEAAAAGGRPVQPPAEPAASMSSEPGDYAVITGRVTAVNPQGTLTVESPRGPVTVALPDAARYQPGMPVQVRTGVHPGR